MTHWRNTAPLGSSTRTSTSHSPVSTPRRRYVLSFTIAQVSLGDGTRDDLCNARALARCP